MNFKKGLYWLFIILIAEFFSCSEKFNNDRFIIQGFRKINKEEAQINFRVTGNDIEEIDWANQSFKLKSDVIKKLDTISEFTPGLVCEYFKVYFDGQFVFRINIYNIRSSCMDIKNEYPYACITKRGRIFTEDGWLIIQPVKDTVQMAFYDCLFNKSIFNYFQRESKLTCWNWSSSEFNAENIPNSNFVADLCKKFSSEFEDNCRLVYHSNFIKIANG